MTSYVKSVSRAFCSVLTLGLISWVGLIADADPVPSPGEALDLSSRLFELGLRQEDPVLVLAAARLRLSHLPAERAPDNAGWVSGAEMLRAASRLAGSDRNLHALISRQSEARPRGSPDGPQVESILIPSKGEIRVVRQFRGGEPAYVYAEGSMTSQLSVTVLDEGSTVCETPLETGRVLCRWIAARDGPTSTVVRNHSEEPIIVLIVTN